jgi:hypothetical protein
MKRAGEAKDPSIGEAARDIIRQALAPPAYPRAEVGEIRRLCECLPTGTMAHSREPDGRLRLAAAIRARGAAGLAALLRAQGVRHQRRGLETILARAERAPEPSECPEIHERIFAHPDDERRARRHSIRALEGKLAAPLVRTPDVLLLSFPGTNVASAAEFAGEMGHVFTKVWRPVGSPNS